MKQGVYKPLIHGCAFCTAAIGCHQLHRCINPNACWRDETISRAMTRWAYQHANYTIIQLNTLTSPTSKQPFYMEYMDHMCFKGYTGSLCGACQPDFGHSGTTCVQCPSKAANAMFFIGMCLLTFLIPGASMLMHITEVKRRSGKVKEWQQLQHNQNQDATATMCGNIESTKNLTCAAVHIHESCAPNVANAAAASGTQQQPPCLRQNPVSRLRLLQRQLLDVRVLDDELDVDGGSSQAANAPTIHPAASQDTGYIHAAQAATAGQIRRRSFKFWHTDVLVVGTCIFLLTCFTRPSRVTHNAYCICM
jgi:hypothetical protein